MAKSSKQEATSGAAPVAAAKYVGLDIGTAFIVSAYEAEGAVKYKTIRSAFLELPSDTKTRKMLEKLNHAFIDTKDKLFLVGDPAVGLANIFSQEVKRPMHKGVLAPHEKDAIDVMRLLIKEVLKDIVDANTTVVYSSPADPADGSFSTLYHRDLMKSILEKDLGVKAIPMNEAHALAYSELSDDGFTGLCCSYGGGMVNSVLTFAGIDALKFSISKGGDWIDENAARSRGITAAQMQAKKEEGVDILKPSSPDALAISIYYRALITEAVESFNQRFKNATDKPQLTNPIPVVIAGGTSQAEGFLDLFKEIVKEKGFPFEIKDIYRAEDALRSVAQGLLLAAMDND